VCHLPSNGAAAGREGRGETVFVQAVHVENQARFWRRLGETWRHALIWQDYATAYDRILLSLGYYRACVARHLRALRRSRAVRVIDIGGGTGNVAVPLARAGCEVTVVDPGRAMLDKLRAKIEPRWRGRVHLLEQSAEELAVFQNASFDAVNILLALYDMDRPDAALQEAIRVLRPGGLIVITEPRRTFSLQVLLAKVDEELRSKPDRRELEEDWCRVRSANLRLDPKSRRGERRWAEDVAEVLEGAGYRDLGFVLSHHDQCATVSGIKTDTQGRKPA
jgi:SAM-dependent methyltransferase